MVTKDEINKFWQSKEEMHNEKLVNRAVAWYEGGHPDYPERAYGLLYLMSKSINFENFEKRVLLPVGKKEFKKMEFRIPVSNIAGYRIELPEKPPLVEIWKIFQKPPPPRIEVDARFTGLNRTIVFTDMVPVEKWKDSLAEVLTNKSR